MLFAAILAFSLQAAADQSGPTRLACEAGPIVREYGGNDWLVYGCSDERSFVVVSSSESPANPFVFMFLFENGSYRIRGEGNGDESATSAAFDELSQLTPDEISNIVSAVSEAPEGAAAAAQN